jgi:phage tail sheath protein FI
MSATLKSPGVYVQEISVFPPSVAEVETAIPGFVGYTERVTWKVANDLLNNPTRVKSLVEFEQVFGQGPKSTVEEVVLDDQNNFVSAKVTNPYLLYDSLRLFFDNGGGPCYVVSVGAYASPAAAPDKAKLKDGVAALKQVDEPTILACPDAANLGEDELGEVQQAMLAQCGELGDRVAVLDTRLADPRGVSFRNKLGINNLKYGAAYTPWLRVNYAKNVQFAQVQGAIKKANAVVGLESLTTDPDLKKLVDDAKTAANADAAGKAEAALLEQFGVYANLIKGVNNTPTVCPPGGAAAGVYAFVDNTRGVWKAPANVSLNAVIEPTVRFDLDDTDALNVDPVAGKSINALRAFAGKGTLVWGARTLAGNDNEWRYVPVRRFFNAVEESVKDSTSWAVFEPNDANTWVKVRGMIENYLTQKWREGALAGATTKEAFFVRCGLGVTMNAQDILEGRMNVEIGMAVVRPAEFIVLKFSHKLQTS